MYFYKLYVFRTDFNPNLEIDLLVGANYFLWLTARSTHNRQFLKLSDALIQLLGGPQYVESGTITEHDYIISMTVYTFCIYKPHFAISESIMKMYLNWQFD